MGSSLALDKPSLDTGKLEKIIQVLMDQVERGIDFQGNAYSLFQTAIVLEDKVRERTRTLETALRELEKTNRALTSAKEQTETAQTRLMEAVESISEGFAQFDSDDRLILCNTKFLEFWPRHPPGGAAGHHLRGTVPLDCRPRSGRRRRRAGGMAARPSALPSQSRRSDRRATEQRAMAADPRTPDPGRRNGRHLHRYHRDQAGRAAPPRAGAGREVDSAAVDARPPGAGRLRVRPALQAGRLERPVRRPAGAAGLAGPAGRFIRRLHPVPFGAGRLRPGRAHRRGCPDGTDPSAAAAAVRAESSPTAPSWRCGATRCRAAASLPRTPTSPNASKPPNSFRKRRRAWNGASPSARPS